MFAKLSALLLALPLVSALTLNPPTNPTSAGTITITWTASTTDPSYFSIELVNTDFHNTYAIANNVQTALGTLTLQLPEVPSEDGYSLEAIAPNDVNTVYSQTGTFSIGATSSSSSSGSSSLTSSSTGTGTSSTSSTLSFSSSLTLTTPTSSFTPLSSSTSSSASSASPSTFSSGAAAFKLAGVAPAGAAILAVIAGAAMVF